MAVMSPPWKASSISVGRVGSVLRRHRPAPHLFGGLEPRILQRSALIGDVEQVGVHGEWRAALPLGFDGNAVLSGVGHQLLPGAQVPDAPRGHHRDVGVEGVGPQLEAHLVVALAGGAVGHRVGADLGGDLHQPLGDEGAGDGGAQQVLALVDGVGPEHGEHEVGGEFLAQILDVDLVDAHGLGLGPGRFQLFALAQIGGEGDHLTAVGVLQPPQNHRGVETAGVGQHDLVQVLVHELSSSVSPASERKSAAT